MVNERQKMLEAKLVNTEMKHQEKKVALSSEVAEVQTAMEETKNIISELSNVQNRMKSIAKEIEDMKTQSSLSNKENSSDKYDSFSDFKKIVIESFY